MAILKESFLPMMLEEMEILDYRLDSLFEQAVAPVDEFNDKFSLLEERDPYEITNEEAFAMYAESLGSTIKSIWRAIARFVRAVFVSSGEIITKSEAENIVEYIKSAHKDGAIEGKSMKKMVQKGFYLLAGIGNSINGKELHKAYKSGDVVNFVMDNVSKISVSNIPNNAKMRVCIGVYNGPYPNLGLLHTMFSIISSTGVQGFASFYRNMRGLKEESVQDVLGYEEFLEETEKKREEDEENPEKMAENDTEPNDKHAKLKSAGKKAAKVGAGIAGGLAAGAAMKKISDKTISPAVSDIYFGKNKMRTGKQEQMSDSESDRKYGKQLYDKGKKQFVSGVKRAGAVTAGYIAVLGFAALVAKKLKAKRAAAAANDPKEEQTNESIILEANGYSDRGAGIDDIVMSTLCYINENQPSGKLLIRMYNGNYKVSKIEINGHQKVVDFRDELVKFCDEVMREVEQLDPSFGEQVNEGGHHVNMFFAGLASMKKAE